LKGKGWGFKNRAVKSRGPAIAYFSQ
jgi:hypothetical protein